MVKFVPTNPIVGGVAVNRRKSKGDQDVRVSNFPNVTTDLADIKTSVDSILSVTEDILAAMGGAAAGVSRYASTNGIHVDANAANVIYAIIGIRLRNANINDTLAVSRVSLISETNDDYEWLLIRAPTIAGVFAFVNEANTIVQAARGITANTVTGGTILTGGFAKRNFQADVNVASVVSGSLDSIVLCARPLGSSADIQGSITWREIS